MRACKRLGEVKKEATLKVGNLWSFDGRYSVGKKYYLFDDVGHIIEKEVSPTGESLTIIDRFKNN